MNDENTVRVYDGVSEVPEGMTPVACYFRESRAVQFWLEPKDPALEATTYLCLLGTPENPSNLWYKLVGTNLEPVTNPAHSGFLDAAFQIYEDERIRRMQ